MKGADSERRRKAAAEDAEQLHSQPVHQQGQSAAHFKTTGPEIWEDTDGKGRYLCCGRRYRRHTSGVGEYLKSKTERPGRRGRATGSPWCLSKGTPGPHKIQGIGAGFVPDTLNTRIYDEIIPVENEDAFAAGRALARREGLLVGISSGAAVFAAAQLAKRPENKGKIIVALLPDTGERYLSTPMFSE